MENLALSPVILLSGYIRPAAQAGRCHASCTITLLPGPEPILVDTGVPGLGGELIRALAARGLAPADIRYVVLTHGHSDHVGNNGLFPEATLLLDTDVSRGDEYWVHDFAAGPFLPVPGVEVIRTPGHSDHDLTVLVRTADGVVAVAGDLFEYENDWGDGAWREWSRNLALQQANRELICARARWIIPGHGGRFAAPGLAELRGGG